MKQKTTRFALTLLLSVLTAASAVEQMAPAAISPSVVALWAVNMETAPVVANMPTASAVDKVGLAAKLP